MQGTVNAERVDRFRWLRTVFIGRRPEWTLVRTVVWVVLVVLVSQFVLLPIRVQGISMLPTYKENRVNFINRMAYWFHEPGRGDVVAIRMAGKHMMLLKRVIALPGETVGFRGGRAVVNGKVLPEPYLTQPCNWEKPEVLLGPGEYFVVGDNRSMPQNDHTFGRATRDRIVGKTLL